MTEPSPLFYDLRGLKCPLPVLRSRKKLVSVPSGSILEIETTDPLAIIDIPHMCNEDGHMLISSESTADGHRFTIRVI